MAGEFLRLTGVVEVQVGPAVKKMGMLQQAVGAVAKDLSKLSSTQPTAGIFPAHTTKQANQLAQVITALDPALAKAAQGLAALPPSAMAAGQQIGNLATAAQKAAPAAAQLAQASNQAAAAMQKTAQAGRTKAQAVIEAGKALKNTGPKAMSLSQTIGKLGHEFDLAFMAIRQMAWSLAILGGPFAAAIATAGGFDSAMRDVNSIIHFSEGQFAMLSEQVLHLSTQFQLATGPIANAKALFEILQAGVTDVAKAQTLLLLSSKAATAGMTDTVTAAKILTGVMNAYSETNLTAARASDVLFKTVEVGTIRFEELAKGLGQSLGLATSAGATLEELGAVIATLTNKGVPARQAQTQLASVLRALVAPTDKAQKTMAEYGLALDEDSVRARGFIDSLKLMATATGNNAKALREMTGRGDAANAILLLMNDSGVKLDENLKRIANSTGATNKAFEEQAKGLRVKIDQMKASLETAGVIIGTVFLPPLKLIVDGLTGSLNAFNSWAGAVQAGITIVGGLVAAFFVVVASIGPMTILFRALYTSQNLLKAAMQQGTVAALEESTAITALGGAAGKTANQMGALAVANKGATADMTAQALATTRFAGILGLVATAVGALGLAYVHAMDKANEALDEHMRKEEKWRDEIRQTTDERDAYFDALDRFNRLSPLSGTKQERIASAFQDVPMDALSKRLSNVNEELQALGDRNKALKAVMEAPFNMPLSSLNLTEKQVAELEKMGMVINGQIIPAQARNAQWEQAQLEFVQESYMNRLREKEVIWDAIAASRTSIEVEKERAELSGEFAKRLTEAQKPLQAFQQNQQIDIFETKAEELKALKEALTSLREERDKIIREAVNSGVPKVTAGLGLQAVQDQLSVGEKEVVKLTREANKERVQDFINTVEERVATEEMGTKEAIRLLGTLLERDTLSNDQRKNLLIERSTLQQQLSTQLRAEDQEDTKNRIKFLDELLHKDKIVGSQRVAIAKKRHALIDKLEKEEREEAVNNLKDQASMLKERVSQIDTEIDKLIERAGSEEELNRLLDERRGLLLDIAKLEGEAAVKGAKNAKDKAREEEKSGERIKTTRADTAKQDDDDRKKADKARDRQAAKVGDLDSQIRDQKIQNLEQANDKESATAAQKISNLQKMLELELQNIAEAERQALEAMSAEEQAGREGALTRQLYEMMKQAAIDKTKQAILDLQKAEQSSGNTFKGVMSADEFWAQNKKWGESFGKGAFGSENVFTPGSFGGGRMPRVLPAGVIPPGVPSGGGLPNPVMQRSSPFAEPPVQFKAQGEIALKLSGEVELIDASNLSRDTMMAIYRETGMQMALQGQRPATAGQT